MIEKISWQGWSDCYRIANGEIELIAVASIGPRILHFGFAGGQNLFKIFPESCGATHESEFVLRGGHRLWTAPEIKPRTYAPDNLPCKVESVSTTLTLTAPVDNTGLERQMSIRMAKEGGNVTVWHRLRNTLPWAVELAPWALTMMAPGGLGITGVPPRGSHAENLLPTNPLVMWAYTDFSDPRWRFSPKYIGLEQSTKITHSMKTGLFNPATWGAYLLNRELFVKRYEADPKATYPDMGCSFEMFTNGDVLELETLGPLTRLEPGAAVEHTERWSLHRGVHLNAFTDAELDRAVAPLI